MTVRARGIAPTLNSIQARRARYIVGTVGSIPDTPLQVAPGEICRGLLDPASAPLLATLARRVIRLLV